MTLVHETNVRAAGAASVGAVRPVRDAGDASEQSPQLALRVGDGHEAVPAKLAAEGEQRQAERRVIAFEVLGTPAPKGSSRAFYKAGMKRAVIVKDNSEKQKQWDGAVREAACAVVGMVDTPPFVDTALDLTIVFRLARPAGHWGKGKRAGTIVASAPSVPRGKPDLDKLVRTTLDAMTGIVFDDDSRVARMLVGKQYAKPGDEGATVRVGALTL